MIAPATALNTRLTHNSFSITPPTINNYILPIFGGTTGFEKKRIANVDIDKFDKFLSKKEA